MRGSAEGHREGLSPAPSLHRGHALMVLALSTSDAQSQLLSRSRSTSAVHESPLWGSVLLPLPDPQMDPTPGNEDRKSVV